MSVMAPATRGRGRSVVAVCGLSAVLACGCLTSGTSHGDPKAGGPDPNISIQSGTIPLAAGVFVDVRYATPFAAAPTLKITEDGGRCMVVRQTATHFRIVNSSNKDVVAHWNAQGVKGAIATAAQPVPAAAPLPQAQAQRPTPRASPVNGLPPEPEPIVVPASGVAPAGP